MRCKVLGEWGPFLGYKMILLESQGHILSQGGPGVLLPG